MHAVSLLTPDDIRALYGTALDCGLAGARETLLRSVDAGYVASLHTAASPGAQLLEDLHAMNVAGMLADGSCPLVEWLKNALSITGSRIQAKVFQRALDSLSPPGPPLGASRKSVRGRRRATG